MNEKPASARNFRAIDTAETSAAAELAARVGGVIGRVTPGLEFLTANRRQGVRGIAAKARGQRLFLDPKLPDVPNTLAEAVRAAAALRPCMLTVRASGGAAIYPAIGQPATKAPHPVEAARRMVAQTADAPVQ